MFPWVCVVRASASASANRAAIARASAATAAAAALCRVHEVRKLHRILNEEDRDVVPDEIPIPFIRVELHREPTHVPGGVGRASFAENGRESDEDRCLLSHFGEE